MQHLSCEIELSQGGKPWKWYKLWVVCSGNILWKAARKSGNHAWSNGS